MPLQSSSLNVPVAFRDIKLQKDLFLIIIFFFLFFLVFLFLYFLHFFNFLIYHVCLFHWKVILLTLHSKQSEKVKHWISCKNTNIFFLQAHIHISTILPQKWCQWCEQSLPLKYWILGSGVARIICVGGGESILQGRRR